jgi:ABC-2 type transport system ATP-binding protein
MAELRRGRLVRARFSGTPEPVPEHDGFLVRERHADRLVFEHTGPLPGLTQWLSRQALTELSVEPLGLAPIYHRYHGAEG